MGDIGGQSGDQTVLFDGGKSSKKQQQQQQQRTSISNSEDKRQDEAGRAGEEDRIISGHCSRTKGVRQREKRNYM